MHPSIRAFWSHFAVAIGLAVVIGLAFTAGAAVVRADATITLGRDPEPPLCVQNPGGTVDITWSIQHTTTPNFVYYKVEDPTRTIIYEDQTYPGGTGLTDSRTFTVPLGAPDGKFWVRVEYWSFEAGNEANAEVTFYVCAAQGMICATKLEDTNCNGVEDPTDTPVTGYWLCLDTPFGDQLCSQTDVLGQVCWPGIPTGDYLVYEQVLQGWVAEGPTSYSHTLGPGMVSTFTFLNARYDTCYGACCYPITGECQVLKETECNGVGGSWLPGNVCDPDPCTGSTPTQSKSWGQIKTIYR